MRAATRSPIPQASSVSVERVWLQLQPRSGWLLEAIVGRRRDAGSVPSRAPRTA